MWKNYIFLAGKLFVIAQWAQEVEAQKNEIKSLPIWVKLMDLPKELWTDDGMGFVASLVGDPKRMDEQTKRKQRLNYAKVCVVVPIDFDFRTEVKVKMLGKEVTIKLEYPWVPKSCALCKRYGHKENKCLEKPTQVWVRKSTPQEVNGGLNAGSTSREIPSPMEETPVDLEVEAGHVVFHEQGTATENSQAIVVWNNNAVRENLEATIESEEELEDDISEGDPKEYFTNHEPVSEPIEEREIISKARTRAQKRAAETTEVEAAASKRLPPVTQTTKGKGGQISQGNKSSHKQWK
ncbi:hypothetical protein IFM89_010626 [Coptis chinensis]|uniref:DUF4283 domain-containing protein n=1 Tax=Coptis chinensis TaxID=261450 RepID=A0A835ILH1_9MAGN|nr:hypothetical protein IFM89_010626 [Coptis chinensis]